MRHRDRRQPRIAGVPGHGETGNQGAELPSVAIMFADISGSTRLYGEIGDVAARDRVAECLDAIAHCVQRHGGRVVKTIGDEAVCIFASADLAVMSRLGDPEAPRRRTGLGVRGAGGDLVGARGAALRSGHPGGG